MKVVEVQVTPNPNARKFVMSGKVSEGSESFFNAEAARGHTLAEKLFGIKGVASVLILGDFVTVNKTPDSKWPEVVGAVKKVLEGK